MHEVVLLVKQQVFSPNDYLCRKNEKAKELFIVKKGKLRVIDDDTGEEMGELTEGATFGELSIVYVKGNLLGTRRCCSLQSVGFSDIYVLYRDDVSRLLQEFPQEYKTIVMNGEQQIIVYYRTLTGCKNFKFLGRVGAELHICYSRKKSF